MEKLRIGILTLPINNNYGGIIQLAALYHFISTQPNFNVIWIDKRHPEKIGKKLVKKIIENNPLYKIWDPKNFKKINLFLKKVQPFFDEYISSKTPTVYTLEELKSTTKDIDVFIVGSDQVWRLKYVKNNYPVYFLSHVPSNKKKIAYAASFGLDSFEGNQKNVDTIKLLLRKFNLVTTRELSGVELCKKLFDYHNAVSVLDPSFLPDSSFYEKMIKKVSFSKKVELFNYVLDNSQESSVVVLNIAKQLNLKIDKISLNNSSSNISHPIENWLAHFYYSDFVVTDSFHGLVFSIIFNKQFIVLGNVSRGLTRFVSLLKLLDLEERMVLTNTFDNVHLKILNEKIDFKKVNQKLEAEKEISKSILLKNIIA